MKLLKNFFSKKEAKQKNTPNKTSFNKKDQVIDAMKSLNEKGTPFADAFRIMTLTAKEKNLIDFVELATELAETTEEVSADKTLFKFADKSSTFYLKEMGFVKTKSTIEREGEQSDLIINEKIETEESIKVESVNSKNINGEIEAPIQKSRFKRRTVN